MTSAVSGHHFLTIAYFLSKSMSCALADPLFVRSWLWHRPVWMCKSILVWALPTRNRTKRFVGVLKSRQAPPECRAHSSSVHLSFHAAFFFWPTLLLTLLSAAQTFFLSPCDKKQHPWGLYFVSFTEFSAHGSRGLRISIKLEIPHRRLEVIHWLVSPHFLNMWKNSFS